MGLLGALLSELLFQPRLFQYLIGRVPRFDFPVDGDATLARVMPNFVVALARAP
jgi:hypothetical protein